MSQDVNTEGKVRNIKKEILVALDEMGITLSSVILFGSRARGDFEKKSDFDLLVVLNKELNRQEKIEIWHKLSKTLHEHFPYTSFDIIIKSTQYFEMEKSIVNTISNEAYIEGVQI